MDSPGSPLPSLSPLSSSSQILHSSPQKASKLSPAPHSVQCPSPERQCVCPCGPFEVKLKAALSLMTFERYPSPTLVPSPYPSDAITGERVPVGSLFKYSRSHVWPDGIHCFCSLRPDGNARSVCLFVPSEGSLRGTLCLQCPDWTPDGVSGCRYLVNLEELFDRPEVLLATEFLPPQTFPLRTRPHPMKLPESGSGDPSSAAASLPPVSSPRLIGVKPGLVMDPERIWSPPPPELSEHVEDVLLPADTEVQEVFDEMVNGLGVSCCQLMAVIDRCVACDKVMALPNIPTHPCIGRTKETGPYPSKRPLHPQNRRTLPTAGSSIKHAGGQVTIEANGDDAQPAEDAQQVDEGTSAAKRKRKVSFNIIPSQLVVVSAAKKPRNTSNGSSSRTTGATPKSEGAEIIDLTGCPVRIPTPESSRHVYRDWNEEFVMYEKA